MTRRRRAAYSSFRSANARPAFAAARPSIGRACWHRSAIYGGKKGSAKMKHSNALIVGMAYLRARCGHPHNVRRGLSSRPYVRAANALRSPPASNACGAIFMKVRHDVRPAKPRSRRRCTMAGAEARLNLRAERGLKSYFFGGEIAVNRPIGHVATSS